MAAAKALTIVDRWEVGRGGGEERKGSQRKKMMHREKKMNSGMDI